MFIYTYKYVYLCDSCASRCSQYMNNLGSVCVGKIQAMVAKEKEKEKYKRDYESSRLSIQVNEI